MKLTIVNARNKYSVPPVGLTLNTTQHSPYTEFKLQRFKTTLELDIHHQYLLRSNVDEEVLLGIYSVTHWCLHQSPEIHSKVTNVLARIDRQKKISVLRSALDDLDYGDCEGAMCLLATKLFNGSVFLASAVLAFAHAERAALFDQQSIKFLASMELNDISESIPGDGIVKKLLRQPSETLRQACARYAAYCEVLHLIKQGLNSLRYGWSDITDCQMARFRTVDVARALTILANRNTSP